MSIDASSARTLVVGAGYTGRRLLAALGDDALGLSRSGGDGGVLRYDLDGETHPAIEISPSAGIVYTVPPSGDADGDRRLYALLAALSVPPARFVYLSTTGVYGDHRGGLVDESMPVAPATDRARHRVAAERLLGRWAQKHDVILIVLRVPGIYGPGRLGLERIREGLPVVDESDAGPGNRIHVDDLVSAIRAALDARTPAGTVNVGDGDNRSSTAFTAEVARQAGLEMPPRISLREAQETFSPMRLSFLNESRRLDLTRMQTVLKPVLRYADPADGIAAALAEERAGAT